LGKIAIQIREADHVATAVSELFPGDSVVVSGVRNGHEIEAKEQIPVGHKIALRPIAADQEILKYGEPIGIATADIEAGCWVHIHNCRGAKARRFSRRSSGET
jgi:altronate dehydratase small subunit